MKFSEKFRDILQEIDRYKLKDSIEHTLLEWEDLDYEFDVDYVDITGDPNIIAYKNKKNRNETRMKVGRFIKWMMGNEVKDRDLTEFVEEYKTLHQQIISGIPVGAADSAVTGFDKWTPLSGDHSAWIKKLFITLTSETYPHGHESELLHLLPSDLTRDEHSNYYKLVGKSDTMFTSHLDTASYEKSPVNLRLGKEGADEMIFTDGKTILGADDKAGVVTMLYMIANNIPGVYYFFDGEERGLIGSSKVAKNFDSIPHVKGVKKVISFDRRDCHSIITHQSSRRCCSDEFSNNLIAELNKSGLTMRQDPGGVYTDSYSFIDYAPECTNVSIGYYSEHTGREKQNLTFLVALCKASIAVKWEELKVARKIGIDPTMSTKYSKFLVDLKTLRFANSFRVYTEEDDAYDYRRTQGKWQDYGSAYYNEPSIIVALQMNDISTEAAHTDIMLLNNLLKKYKSTYTINMRRNNIKITLK